MANESDDQDHNNHQPPGDREPNPFVAFRRFADEQITSIFERLSEPFGGDFEKREHAWKAAQKEAWRRFESSYERATNPERRQTERRSVDDPIHVAPVPRYRSLEAETNEEREKHSSPGLFDRTMTALGKTSQQEEAPRAVDSQYDEQTHHDSRHCSRRPATRTMIVAPSGVEESASIDHADDRRHGQGSFGPFGWSWSWGPWSFDTRHQAAGTEENDSTTHISTLGPWEFGPIRISPMSTSATFPEDLGRQVKSLIDDHESMVRKAFEDTHTADSWKPESSAEVEEARMFAVEYNPLLLSLGDSTRERLDWCTAFEDLMAAETGQEMHGNFHHKAPRSLMHQLGFLNRMVNRQLVSAQAPWHQGIFFQGPHAFPRMSGAALKPKVWEVDATTEADDESATELDYYERQEAVAQAEASTPSRRTEGTSKRELVSRISSVERMVMPDGSVRIQRTLRRRYADGSEDTEDTTEETQAPQRPAEGRAKDVEVSERKDLGSDEGLTQSKTSWFW